jgi:hypothetical protein
MYIYPTNKTHNLAQERQYKSNQNVRGYHQTYKARLRKEGW